MTSRTKWKTEAKLNFTIGKGFELNPTLAIAQIQSDKKCAITDNCPSDGQCIAMSKKKMALPIINCKGSTIAATSGIF